MARLVTSATVNLLRDAAGLDPVARTESEIAADALRSAPSLMAAFGPKMKTLKRKWLRYIGVALP